MYWCLAGVFKNVVMGVIITSVCTWQNCVYLAIHCFYLIASCVYTVVAILCVCVRACVRVCDPRSAKKW